MLTLKCDMCGYECLWANIQKLPTGWESIEYRELCEKCVDNYHKFRNDLDTKHLADIEEYFSKEKK